MKLQEQRAKTQAQQERRRAERDALRTGRAPQRQAGPEGGLSAAEPAPSADRRARIEALRQKRIEQLRKLREQRAEESGEEPAAQSTATGPQGQRPTASFGQSRQHSQREQMRELTGRQRAGKQQQPASRRSAAQQPQPQPSGGGQRGATAPTRRPTPEQPDQRRRQQPPEPEPPQEDRRPQGDRRPEVYSSPIDDSAIKDSEVGSSGRSTRRTAGTDRALFGSRRALRNAVIAQEVLGSPVSMRPNGSGAIVEPV